VGQRDQRPGGEGGRALLTEATPRLIDLSGAEELCSEPAPLARVRRAYAELGAGQVLEVRTPVAEHAFAVRAWSRKNGVRLVGDERVDGVQRLLLSPG